MKKTILTIALFSTGFLLVSIPHANAQGSTYGQPVHYSARLLVLAAAAEFSALKEVLGKNQINVKALVDFKKSFAGINDEMWYRESYGYSARFFGQGSQTDVSYSEKGKWMYSILQYDETKLARDLRMQIRSVYYDCRIKWVHEIILPRKTVYMVLIEDDSTIKNIRIGDGEMEVVEELSRS